MRCPLTATFRWDDAASPSDRRSTSDDLASASTDVAKITRGQLVASRGWIDYFETLAATGTSTCGRAFQSAVARTTRFAICPSVASPAAASISLASV